MTAQAIESMNRRGFLGRLLAGISGIALAPDILWKPVVTAEPLPLLKSSAITGLEGMTREVARLISSRVQGDVFTGSAYKIGHSELVRSLPRTLTDQVSCDFSLYPTDIGPEGLDVERWLEPVAASLTARIQKRNLTVFAPLEILPWPGYGSSVVSGHGISVRGIKGLFHDATTGLYIPSIRFDVLGGRA